MKLLNLVTLCTASLLILSGCAIKPTPKKEALIDATLPTLALTKNGAIADINSIALEWEPIDDQRVDGVFIYKVSQNSQANSSDDYYDTVTSRFSTHYVDTKIEPNTKYSYYFKTYSATSESRKSPVTTITSLAPMESVSWIHGRENMPRSAKIIWRPHINEKVKAYILQRRTLQESEWKDVATINNRLSAEYIDKDLKDNFTYKYRIRSLTYDGVISKPSQEVTIVTKELPSPITQITASNNLPRVIKINWQGGGSKDFAKYRIYRSTNIDSGYDAVGDTVNNSYIDKIDQDGKEYFYRISAVDVDNLESINKNFSALGRTLVKPAAPVFSEARYSDGRVKLSWSKTDDRTVSYIVQKEYKKGFFETKIEDFENITGNELSDTNLVAGGIYYYRVFSVDANKIKSNPSTEALIKIEEGAKIIKSAPISTPRKIEKNVEYTAPVASPTTEVVDEANVNVIVPMKDFN